MKNTGATTLVVEDKNSVNTTKVVSPVVSLVVFPSSRKKLLKKGKR